MYQDGWSTVDGDNAVVDGICLISTLLSVDRLKIYESCMSLIAEIPGYPWSEVHAERGEDVPVKGDDHGLDGPCAPGWLRASRCSAGGDRLVERPRPRSYKLIDQRPSRHRRPRRWPCGTLTTLRRVFR